jgi:hypothetical protein
LTELQKHVGGTFEIAIVLSFGYWKIAFVFGKLPVLYLEEQCSLWIMLSALCDVGTEWNDVTGQCEPCKIGFYQDEEYQKQCKACDSGKTTENTGQISEDSCVGKRIVLILMVHKYLD